MITLLACDQQIEWDREVLALGGHPLQLWGWGEVKAAHEWVVDRVFFYDEAKVVGAAQLLIKRLPRPLKALVYVPRGPVAKSEDREAVLTLLADYSKEQYSAVVLTIEPDWETMEQFDDWQPSTNTILIPRTLILDLGKSEDELLADMTKKTRQYIRKSASDGVEVRKVTTKTELASCLAIYKHTAERAKFALHADQYYDDIFDKLGDHSLVMAAVHEGKPVAFLWLVISHSTAFELYGGMSDKGQELRANYVLKWQTIQRTKEWGVERYDFNGLLNDGVSTFKQGFASHETMLVGTYDKPLSPLYYAWQHGLPYAKKIVRVLKKR